MSYIFLYSVQFNVPRTQTKGATSVCKQKQNVTFKGNVMKKRLNKSYKYINNGYDLFLLIMINIILQIFTQEENCSNFPIDCDNNNNWVLDYFINAYKFCIASLQFQSGCHKQKLRQTNSSSYSPGD